MLKKIWEKWKKIAHRIGVFQSKILLSILYVTIVLPFSIAMRMFFDPLRLKPDDSSTYWIKKIVKKDSLEEARRQ